MEKGLGLGLDAVLNYKKGLDNLSASSHFLFHDTVALGFLHFFLEVEDSNLFV